MNASIIFNDENVEEIRSIVMNIRITITPSLIDDIINFEEDGANIEWYRTNLTFRNNIISITKSSGNPSKASDMTPIKNLWYRLIITIFLPRDQNSLFLSIDDKHLMHLLISREVQKTGLTKALEISWGRKLVGVTDLETQKKRKRDP
ncbi:hypothetical protein KIW84_052305 [Lathyrus oleraceus]|uniref:Uncharacterized protein n=1 Tax=Pisum sativum TaxID=3888 RepID=A0A9D4WPF0_PEA|nr:hypothetical protein KIW84_052305 [Pisum sativum]